MRDFGDIYYIYLLACHFAISPFLSFNLPCLSNVEGITAFFIQLTRVQKTLLSCRKCFQLPAVPKLCRSQAAIAQFLLLLYTSMIIPILYHYR